MAGEEGVWRVPWLGRPSVEGLRDYISLHRQGLITLALTFGVVLATFVVYRLTYYGAAAHNHPVRLADAFLHGRLDVADGANLIGFLDFAIYDGKYYPLEPPGTALVLLPGVALFGLALNQTLVSIVIGAITAGVVFHLSRRLTDKPWEQLVLTAMFSFGTVYWWNSTYAGVWYFNHAVAVLFLFLAVYETLVSKRPFTAGLALGAAYITRLPTIMSLPFFVIMFAQWRLGSEPGGPLRLTDYRPRRLIALLRRIDYRPLVLFGAGVGIFVAALSIYTYVRFDELSPSASYYHWSVWETQPWLSVPGGTFENGLFDTSYVSRHISLFFEKPLYMQSAAPYVLPSWNGAAFWATTPVFLYAFLAGVSKRWLRLAGGAGMVLSIGVFAVLPNLGRGPGHLPWFDWAQWDVAHNLNLLPFFLLIAYGLYAGVRGNKLVLGCWLAIILISFVHFTVGVTGWPQFGYRYQLDYAPFLFLLTWQGMGGRLKWHHVVLITIGIVINLGGVLWINEFSQPGAGWVELRLESALGQDGIQWVNW